MGCTLARDAEKAAGRISILWWPEKGKKVETLKLQGLSRAVVQEDRTSRAQRSFEVEKLTSL